MKLKRSLTFLEILLLAASSGFSRDLREARDGPRDSRDPWRFRASERGMVAVGQTGEYPALRATRAVPIAIDSETGEIYQYDATAPRRNA